VLLVDQEKENESKAQKIRDVLIEDGQSEYRRDIDVFDEAELD